MLLFTGFEKEIRYLYYFFLLQYAHPSLQINFLSSFFYLCNSSFLFCFLSFSPLPGPCYHIPFPSATPLRHSLGATDGFHSWTASQELSTDVSVILCSLPGGGLLVEHEALRHVYDSMCKGFWAWKEKKPVYYSRSMSSNLVPDT